jgi:hypothetical protein
MEDKLNIDNWEAFKQLLPQGWEEKAKELGIIGKKKKFKTPEEVIRVVLIHLATGSSLKQAAMLASLGGIVDVSDVAILDKLKKCSELFRWMAERMLEEKGINLIPIEAFEPYNVKAIDATVVNEPGSRGTDWRIHYSMELFSLRCVEYMITGPEKGESCTNFSVSNNDLILGDRGYCNAKGMNYISGKGGYFALRYKRDGCTFYDDSGEKIDVLENLKRLKDIESLDLKANIKINGSKRDKRAVRICALKKDKESAQKARKKTAKELKKKQKKVSQETLEYQDYIIVVTNLPDSHSADMIFELYRLRWQVELEFKRLKSIFGLGQLPKKDEQSAKAWLHGNLVVALLAQKVIEDNQLFFPVN